MRLIYFHEYSHSIQLHPHLESSLDYLGKWMKHTENIASFNWILLQSEPKWAEIDKSYRNLVEKEIFESSKHQKLFHAFGYLHDYMNEERIKEYNKQSKPVAERWIEFFNAMNDLVDCAPLDELVAYVLSIPGI